MLGRINNLLLLICLLFAACQNEKAVSDLDGETGEALLAKVYYNEKFGYINTGGEFLIEPNYLDAYSFSEGLACVYMGGRKEGNQFLGGYYGYINTRGEVIIPGKFPGAGSFHQGFAPIPIAEGQYRFIDKQGNYIGPIFDELGVFNQRLAPAVKRSENRMGYIDNKGNWKIAFKNGLFIGPFTEGKAYVKSADNVFGYIDQTGRFVIEAQYENAHIFSEGLAGVKTKDQGLYGFINESNTMKIPPVYRQVLQFKDGICAVSDDIDWGFIDKNGDPVIDFKYAAVSNFSEGLCAVRTEWTGKVGYINRKGDMQIDLIFDQASDFHYGLAVVKKDAAVYYINTAGKIEIEGNFSFAGPFVNVEETTSSKDL